MSDDITLSQLVDTLADDSGPDLRGYKTTTLERRIRRRMSQVGAGSFAEYLERVRADRHETVHLLSTVLINVTEFFRDPQAWELIRRELLPKIFEQIGPSGSFRAWSAGCATGEEAYSLVILISELLGRSLPEFEIKIYATDIDEDALNVARRGEYHVDKLRRIKPLWREKYFSGHGSLLRINRELRRMVIFGRSNIVSDAPISHCNLVICRNVLIYFDTKTQKQVLSRLHYALDPGGVLFLGKAESKLTESPLFRPLNSRWRVFQKPGRRADEALENRLVFKADDDPAAEKDSAWSLFQRHLLDTVRSAVILLDANDIVVAHNEAAIQAWGLGNSRFTGRRLQNTELVLRCPELLSRMEAVRGGTEPLLFSCSVKNNDSEDRRLAVTLRVVVTGDRERAGMLIYAEDVTPREKLNSTIEQLEATSEELQSANEELETTNEELQSTNEELETTNEELQSTNEELETTNEELQSLNEELENMNEELEHRTQELHQVNSRYAETLQSMPWPVVLVDADEKIQLWNSAAQQLFGVGSTSVVGVGLDQLPINSEARRSLLRRFRAVLSKPKASLLRIGGLGRGSGALGEFNVRFTPISRADNKTDGVLIMFGPTAALPQSLAVASRGSPGKNNKNNKKHSGNSNQRKK